jgi:Cu(I)/Ag(I) efflux system membrane protein CusA/SilA
VLVTGANGAQIPLGQVADIRQVSGPAQINSENGLLEVSVLMNARGRDAGSVIADADKAIRARVKMPLGYYYNWSGQFESEIRAKKRLQIVVPIAIGIIYILLYLTYRSFLEAAHVLLAVPFALTGGLYLLWLLHYNFSVAVWVGFIALFGTAVQTTVVMVIYLEEAVERKRQERGTLTLREAVKEAHDRLDHRGGIVTDFLEQSSGIGVDTTSSHASPWRHAQFARARADRHTHHFHVAA